jgi:hypothetical protein
MIDLSNLNLTEQQKGLRSLYISEWTEFVEVEAAFYKNVLSSPLVSPFFDLILQSEKLQMLIKQHKMSGSLPSTIWNKELFGELYLQTWKTEVLRTIDPLVKGKIKPIKGFLDGIAGVRWHLDNIANYGFWYEADEAFDQENDELYSFHHTITQNSTIFYRFFETYLDTLEQTLVKSGKTPKSIYATDFYQKCESFMEFHQIVRELLIESKVSGRDGDPVVMKQVASRLTQILQDEFRKTIFDKNGNLVLVRRTVNFPDVISAAGINPPFSGTRKWISTENKVSCFPTFPQRLLIHSGMKTISNWLSSIT